MRISGAERDAIRAVLDYGASHGYGNLISHLQTAWAASLMRSHGMDEASARAAAGGPGYPFEMQRDLVASGEWDETGARYRASGDDRVPR